MNEVVEVAFTRNAGWCWRCHVCDLNVFNLREQAEARRQAQRHETYPPHVARLAEGDPSKDLQTAEEPK